MYTLSQIMPTIVLLIATGVIINSLYSEMKKLYALVKADSKKLIEARAEITLIKSQIYERTFKIEADLNAIKIDIYKLGKSNSKEKPKPKEITKSQTKNNNKKV